VELLWKKFCFRLTKIVGKSNRVTSNHWIKLFIPWRWLLIMLRYKLKFAVIMYKTLLIVFDNFFHYQILHRPISVFIWDYNAKWRDNQLHCKAVFHSVQPSTVSKFVLHPEANFILIYKGVELNPSQTTPPSAFPRTLPRNLSKKNTAERNRSYEEDCEDETSSIQERIRYRRDTEYSATYCILLHQWIWRSVMLQVMGLWRS